MSLLIDIIKKTKGKTIEKVCENTQKLRYAKCRTCENLLSTGNCKVCGCFVKDKAKYKGEQCPINKW